MAQPQTLTQRQRQASKNARWKDARNSVYKQQAQQQPNITNIIINNNHNQTNDNRQSFNNQTNTNAVFTENALENGEVHAIENTGILVGASHRNFHTNEKNNENLMQIKKQCAFPLIDRKKKTT